MGAPRAGQTTGEQAVELIAVEPTVYVRSAAVPGDEDGAWRLRLLELTSGAPPPGWDPAQWTYPKAVLAAATYTGEEVAAWLRDCRATIAGHPLTLPKLSTQVHWQRLQSHWLTSYQTLDWPVHETTLASLDAQIEPQEPLLSTAEAPSFSSLYTAAACFFVFRRQQTESLHQGVAYRHQDTRGRIRLVRVLPDEISVEVVGDAVHGMSVELAGDVPGPRHDVVLAGDGTAEPVRFPLTGGLPAGAWVLLRSGAEWIDRRTLVGPWARQHDPEVEFVEPGTRLEVLLANREGPQAEFKREVPAPDGNPRNVMKTVCAFANGDGGSLLFGIDDEYALVGMESARVASAQDHLAGLVRAWVHPMPATTFETLPIADSDRIVLELRVEPGTSLHGYGPAGGPHSVISGTPRSRSRRRSTRRKRSCKPGRP
ncbi:MAG: helix-turn-helix domain-containing protein [Candidatus Limnocylindrales bacterium]